MLPFLLMTLAATARILPSLEFEIPEMSELAEYEQPDPKEIEIAELPELPETEVETETEESSGSICSCAVRCCTRPEEIRRSSIIFHIPQMTSPYCCGCVVCPAMLFQGLHGQVISAPAPMQQLPQNVETEPAEVEVVGHDHTGAAILEVEPAEVEPI